jgi:dGTP triphosphohydrolase
MSSSSASPSQHLGLNLSWETRICLLKSKVPEGFPLSHDLPRATTPYLEGQVVDLCDRAAYVCHDLDDALRSGLVDWEDFADIELVSEARERAMAQLRDQGESQPSKHLLRRRSVGAMVSLLVGDLAPSRPLKKSRGLRAASSTPHRRRESSTNR